MMKEKPKSRKIEMVVVKGDEELFEQIDLKELQKMI